jgi:hypothetical protein
MVRTMMKTLAAAAVVLGVGLVGLPAASAGSAPVTVADGANDGHGAGDIRGLRIFQSEAQGYNVAFQIRTQNPLNLGTNPAFRNPAAKSQIRFNVDTDGDRAFEAVGFVESGPAGATARFAYPGINRPEGLCAPTLGQPTLNSIRVTLPSFCLGGAFQIRAGVRYRLDVGGNGTIDSDDRAPNLVAYSGTYLIVT